MIKQPPTEQYFFTAFFYLKHQLLSDESNQTKDQSFFPCPFNALPSFLNQWIQQFMLARLTRFSRHFLSQLQQSQGSAVIEPSSTASIPVHLRPYDKTKYEVPMEKIKINSGYAFLEVEPFPRAKIMKTCYHILEQLSKGFPETCVYRIYNQERTKYFMKLVDENNDIQVLEEYFGVETIELFIDNLVKQLEVINIMRHSKIWELESSTALDEELVQKLTPEQQVKKPAYKKSERSKVNFVQE